jgi:hypothetical protein
MHILLLVVIVRVQTATVTVTGAWQAVKGGVLGLEAVLPLFG